jgi:outer membrane protein TolC
VILALPLLLLGLCATVVRAQPARRALPLQEVIAVAVRGNPTLAAAGADLVTAEGGVTTARGLDDLVIDGSSAWLESRREIVAGNPLQQPELDDVLLQLSLTKPLATGGRIGLRLSTEYTRTEFLSDLGMGDTQLSISEVKSPSLQLTFFHPLLRGVGRDVARAQQRRARAARDVAGWNREAAADALVRDLVGAYWELVYATEELGIRRASADSAREQLRIVTANIGVGKQPPSASAEVEVAIALREEDALNAEQALRERSIEVARLMGMELGPQAAELVGADRPDVLPPLASGEQALTLAMAHNPQLMAARAQTQAQTIEIDVADNGLLPQLDFSAAGGPRGNSENTERAFRQLSGVDSYDLTAQLVFQEPVQRRAQKGALTTARAGLAKARFSEADLTLQLRSAVLRVQGETETARRRLEVLARSTDAAALDLAAERARFEVGRATNFDVLRRQEELAQAQLRQMRARIDYQRGVAALEALTGELLARYGVRLP